MKESDQPPAIEGYDFGSTTVARSPITLAELAELKASALFTD
jgi:hypothetical protein